MHDLSAKELEAAERAAQRSELEALAGGLLARVPADRLAGFVVDLLTLSVGATRHTIARTINHGMKMADPLGLAGMVLRNEVALLDDASRASAPPQAGSQEV